METGIVINKEFCRHVEMSRQWQPVVEISRVDVEKANKVLQSFRVQNGSSVGLKTSRTPSNLSVPDLGIFVDVDVLVPDLGIFVDVDDDDGGSLPEELSDDAECLTVHSTENNQESQEVFQLSVSPDAHTELWSDSQSFFMIVNQRNTSLRNTTSRSQIKGEFHATKFKSIKFSFGSVLLDTSSVSRDMDMFLNWIGMEYGGGRSLQELADRGINVFGWVSLADCAERSVPCICRRDFSPFIKISYLKLKHVEFVKSAAIDDKIAAAATNHEEGDK